MCNWYPGDLVTVGSSLQADPGNGGHTNPVGGGALQETVSGSDWEIVLLREGRRIGVFVQNVSFLTSDTLISPLWVPWLNPRILKFAV